VPISTAPPLLEAEEPAALLEVAEAPLSLIITFPSPVVIAAPVPAPLILIFVLPVFVLLPDPVLPLTALPEFVFVPVLVLPELLFITAPPEFEFDPEAPFSDVVLLLLPEVAVLIVPFVLLALKLEVPELAPAALLFPVAELVVAASLADPEPDCPAKFKLRPELELVAALFSKPARPNC